MKKFGLLLALCLFTICGFSEGKEYASFTYSSTNKVIQLVNPDGSAQNFPITNKKVMFADVVAILSRLSKENGWKVVSHVNAGPGTFNYLLERDSE